MNSRLRFSTNEIGLVDFRIKENRDGVIYEGIYGINVAKVQEIIHMPEVFDLPASPNYVVGIFDLRGTVIPLVDLATWIGIKSRELDVDNSTKRVIIAEFNNFKIGFIVHEAKLIRRVTWENIEPAMFSTNNAERGKITGVTRIENNLTLLILDLESIIGELDFYINERVERESISAEEIKKFNGNVLVVDDSSIARGLIKKHLKSMGFNVIEARDGQEGLKLLEDLHNTHKEKFNKFLSLIISDVEMPKMDGFHFVEEIKHDVRFASVPVIFNSSICDKYSEQRSKDVGANAYLVKFDADAFYEEILKIMQ